LNNEKTTVAAVTLGRGEFFRKKKKKRPDTRKKKKKRGEFRCLKRARKLSKAIAYVRKMAQSHPGPSNGGEKARCPPTSLPCVGRRKKRHPMLHCRKEKERGRGHRAAYPCWERGVPNTEKE